MKQIDGLISWNTVAMECRNSFRDLLGDVNRHRRREYGLSSLNKIQQLVQRATRKIFADMVVISVVLTKIPKWREVRVLQASCDIREACKVRDDNRIIHDVRLELLEQDLTGLAVG